MTEQPGTNFEARFQELGARLDQLLVRVNEELAARQPTIDAAKAQAGEHWETIKREVERAMADIERTLNDLTSRRRD
jgi:hypothetical protein